MRCDGIGAQAGACECNAHALPGDAVEESGGVAGKDDISPVGPARGAGERPRDLNRLLELDPREGRELGEAPGDRGARVVAESTQIVAPEQHDGVDRIIAHRRHVNLVAAVKRYGDDASLDRVASCMGGGAVAVAGRCAFEFGKPPYAGVQAIGAEDDSRVIDLSCQALNRVRAAIPDIEPDCRGAPDFGARSPRGIEQYSVQRGAPDADAFAGKRRLDMMGSGGEADPPKRFARGRHYIEKAQAVQFRRSEGKNALSADLSPGKGALLNDEHAPTSARQVDRGRRPGQAAADDYNVIHMCSIAAEHGRAVRGVPYDGWHLVRSNQVRSALRAVRVVHPFPSVLVTTTALLLLVVANASAPSRVYVGIGLGMLLYQAAIGAVNDIVDRESDRTLKPSKPLVSGALTRRTAMGVAVCACAAGLGVTTILSWQAWLLGVACLACGLAYDLRLKRSQWSWTPYSLAFSLLPVWVFVAAEAWSNLLWWVFPLGTVLGFALHLSNQAPDVAAPGADYMGLPSAIGASRSDAIAVLAFVLAAAGATIVLALAGHLVQTWIAAAIGAGVLACSPVARRSSIPTALFGLLAFGAAGLAVVFLSAA